MSPPESLMQLQTWFQDAVLPGGRADPAEAERVLEPSAYLEAHERLGIYRRMIALRLEETLASLHPALRSLLGAEAFGELSRAYFRAHPSRSYTLADVASALPRFLETWAGWQTAVLQPAPGMQPPHLDHAAVPLYEALVDGVPLGEALDRVSPSSRGRIGGWLKAWVAAGAFVAVRVPALAVA